MTDQNMSVKWSKIIDDGSNILSKIYARCDEVVSVHGESSRR